MAILVRELARATAAAYAGVPLRALLLMPTGGVMALAPREGGLPRASQRLIAWTGSLANFGAALLLLGFAYGVDPAVSLVKQPWITIDHILRSAVWLQVAIGLVNLFPTRQFSIPSLRLRPGRVPNSVQRPAAATEGRPTPAPSEAISTRRPAFGFLTALALALILSGFLLTMLWPVLLGITMIFVNYIGRAAAVGSADAASLTVRDVMLTEFTTLPASGTLRDALRRVMHRLQDTFPVVRGDRLVGWISRGALALRLQAEGDGYLQGSMVRSLQVASPDEKLGDALRRAATLGASEFIPVVEDGAMIGMLTPGSLERAMGQVRLAMPQPERGDVRE